MDRGIYEFHKGNWSFTKSSYKSHSIFVMEGRGTIGVVGAPMQAKTTMVGFIYTFCYSLSSTSSILK